MLPSYPTFMPKNCCISSFVCIVLGGELTENTDMYPGFTRNTGLFIPLYRKTFVEFHFLSA